VNVTAKVDSADRQDERKAIEEGREPCAVAIQGGQDCSLAPQMYTLNSMKCQPKIMGGLKVLRCHETPCSPWYQKSCTSCLP
jgi:hypothetical protein